MSAERLLRVIHDACEAGGGTTDDATVRQAYSDGFHSAFNALISDGYVRRTGPDGTIALSNTGRLEIKRLIG